MNNTTTYTQINNIELIHNKIDALEKQFLNTIEIFNSNVCNIFSEIKIIKESLLKKSTSINFSQDEILEKLSIFEKSISNVKLPSSNTLPDWSIDLYKISKTDLQLRMHLLRIPFEPDVFKKKLQKKLNEQKELE